jgi:putative transcriptional regulator
VNEKITFKLFIMPIVMNLDLMLVKRKMRLTELSEKMGISLNNLSMIKTGKAKAIRFSTLKKLYEILECRPGDLIDNVTEEEYKKLYRL